VKKSTAALATTLAAAGAARLATKRVIDRWAHNPNPLAGESLEFPQSSATTVTTDDGARLAVRRVGSGPTVVLVHGLTGNRHDWAPIARRLLNEGFEIVAVEQRGHGDSTRGTDGYGALRLAADLAQVLSALDLRDVTLVGHSMGGMAAMAMVLEHPKVTAERVRKLVTVATTPTLRDLRIKLGLHALSAEALHHFTRFDVRLRLGAGLVAFGKEPSLELIDHVIESTGRCPDDVRRDATAGLIGFHITEQLASIDLDTLVLAGTHDKLTPLRYNTMIADHIPRSRLEPIDGGGHMLILDRADRIAFLLAEFTRLATRNRSERV
jgi:pimeloyl-ACP methyl ester carboxylesterase